MNIKPAFSLAILAGSALAQSLTQLTLPEPGSTLEAGCNVTVQVGLEGYPENIDVVAIVIGLAQCNGGSCDPPSSHMGDILYQGAFNPQPGDSYTNYTVTVPEGFTPGNASLNVINFAMVGASYSPFVNYLNVDVDVVA